MWSQLITGALALLVKPSKPAPQKKESIIPVMLFTGLVIGTVIYLNKKK